MNRNLLFSAFSFAILSFGFNAAYADTSKILISFDSKLEKEFATNYGEREKSIISDMVKEELIKKFGNSDYRFEINIKDVQPNRPTMNQMNEKPGLSYQSFSVGGANISGAVFDSNGNLIAQTQYDYHNPNIYETQYYWTWHDAEWAFQRFASKLSKARK